jgi:alcohol dehydrogenase-like protein
MASFPFIHAGQGRGGEGSWVLAAVTRSPGEMVIEDVPGPGRARAGHVIVRPERVGICGSDFHLFSGDLGALSGTCDFYPRVQGHEVSAIVEDPGDGTAHGNIAGALRRGDRVAIWPLLPCGHCYPCRSKRPNVCPDFRLVGVHLDGGLQERLEVPAGLVFKTGDLDPDSACFVEPASVAVHALERGRLQSQEQVRGRGVRPRAGQAGRRGQDRGDRELTATPSPSQRNPPPSQQPAAKPAELAAKPANPAAHPTGTHRPEGDT